MCKFDGAYVSLVGGGRDWTGYLEEGNGMPELAIQTNDDGVIYIGLGFYPEYFMSDPVTGGKDAPVPYISVAITDGEGMSILYEPEDVEAYCGAKIISYEYDEPIENMFN